MLASGLLVGLIGKPKRREGRYGFVETNYDTSAQYGAGI
jgi:hypothetical protein